MTCRELINFLMDYLDDALPAPERVAFDDHLKICPNCRAYLQRYQQTVAVSRACLADDALPPDVPGELIDAILASRKAGG